MVASMGDPPDRVPWVARVLRLHIVAVRTSTRLRGVLGLTAIDTQVAVAQLTTVAHVEHGVDDTVDAKVGDLGLSA